MKTQVEFEKTDIHTGNVTKILGTIEHIDDDYVLVIGDDNKFHKVFYQELTYKGRV